MLPDPLNPVTGWRYRPANRAMFQMLGVISEFERSIIRSRVKAGMARARLQGKSGERFGQRPLARHKVKQIRSELHNGTGIIKTARPCGTGVSAVQRIKRELDQGV
jgi:DNA invertase Pin-like site-specific DNA recombinase